MQGRVAIFGPLRPTLLANNDHRALRLNLRVSLNVPQEGDAAFSRA